MRRMLDVDIPGKRRLGRPNLRWKDACKRDMTDVGLKEDKTTNRAAWRNTIISYTGDPRCRDKPWKKKKIRRRVGDFGEKQQGSRKGRVTADGLYVLRQMVEKRLEVQGSMVLGFVDLEKAFDTVPREMVMATLRWMGVPEAEVRMAEGTYENTTVRVVVGEGASEEFEVKIGLTHGSLLSPMLFMTVLDLISRKTVVKDAMKKLLYSSMQTTWP